MSKARLVITAVIIEGRTQAEVAAAYGVSKGWVSKLIARYHAEGEAAFEPRSRRPRTSPGALDSAVVELILELREQACAPPALTPARTPSPGTSSSTTRPSVSRSTISRHLARAGLVTPEPEEASEVLLRPVRSSDAQRDLAVRLHPLPPHHSTATGVDVEIISWLDDCTRYALHVTAHARVTGPIATSTFRQTLTTHGIPASTLTDNGMVYTVRLAGGRGGRNTFEHELRRLHVVQKNSRPNHPTTCGKVERFQQTLKKWLRAQPVQPTTLAELQALHRRLRRGVQPPPTAPVAATPSHPGRPLRRHAQGNARATPATPTPTTGSATTASTRPAP